MNDDKIISFSLDSSPVKNQSEFKFQRQNDRALTHVNSGKEIWFFKNEILKDMKVLEKTLTDKFNLGNIEIKDKMNNLNQNIKTLEIKLKGLVTKITEDNSMKEKMASFDKVKNKLLDNILVNDMKVNSLDREMRQSIVSMNNTLRETVIYAGVIGPSCKFQTFHDFIDYVINQINILGTYKDKNMMDFTSFKKKIDSSVQGFKLTLDNFMKSSTELVMDSNNKIDENINKLFHEYDDKIEIIKNDLEETKKNTDNKIDDVENKLIKEMNKIKTKIVSFENDLNIHLKSFMDFKEDVNKFINESKTKNTTQKNSTNKNLETNSINNNKSKINKRKNIIRNEKKEEIKNNNTENTNKNINLNTFKNLKEFKRQKVHTAGDNKDLITNSNKDIKDEISKNSNDILEINNLNKNIDIQVENSNSIDLNKYAKEKINKGKDYDDSYEYNKKKLILSRFEQEDEKMLSLSPKRKSIKIKNMKNTFNTSNHTNELDNSKMSLKTIDNANNFEVIKSINVLDESQQEKYKEKRKEKNPEKSKEKVIEKEKLKEKNINKEKEKETETEKNKEKEKVNLIIKTPNTAKNIFNKNLKLFKEQNKLWLFDKSKRQYKKQNSINNIKSLNIETNDNKKFQNMLYDRYNINYQKSNKSSAKFKNIILTMEGTKKMIYETKDFTKGKNLYHIETLSDKNRKKSYLRERLESCKPFLLKKYYEKNMNIFYPIGKGEPFDFINYKKHRLLLNKSASSNVNIKNKDKNSNDYGYNTINANNYSHSLNITKYNFPNKKRYKSFGEEKSFQTEKN